MGMKLTKPRTLSGFMELLPNEQIVFNHFKQVIQQTYEKFGFLPLDTPVLEYSDVLLAKAGGETEKQIYEFSKGDTKLCMRYDLTVPLAKYVSMHSNELAFPFKRYQIGKVYRGERAQRGRFREFYQCDIDVIGKNNLDIIYDAEIPSVIYNVFKQLNIGEFEINISNRKLLKGLMEVLSLANINDEVLRIIDKKAKIGMENVNSMLSGLGIGVNELQTINEFLNITGNNFEIISQLKQLGLDNVIFAEGINELEQVISAINAFGVEENCVKIDLSITRGLDYYTGTIYETFLTNHREIGSICSGGRYDNLTSFYSEEKMQGVGICIGLTRLFDQLIANNIIDVNKMSISKAIILPMSKAELNYAIEVSTFLRNNNVNCELFVDEIKFKNKMSYASKKNIQFAVIIGEDEIKNKVVSLKNLNTFEQTCVNLEKALEIIKSN